MAISSVKKAEYQREGVLRLEMMVEEFGQTYQVIAVVPLDPPHEMTIVSGSRIAPSPAEVKTAVREYLQETGTVPQ